MGFPSGQLVAESATMYCHIFENQLTGLKRGLFWSITMCFAPILYDDSELSCSATCEWIPWNSRRWQELHGVHLEASYGDVGIESSFYMGRHDPGILSKLLLTHLHGSRFGLSLKMTVDFQGYKGGDEDPAMLVEGNCELDFEGLRIVPENLKPKPTSVDDLNSVALRFVDLTTYLAPVHEGHAYRYPPKV